MTDLGRSPLAVDRDLAGALERLEGRAPPGARAWDRQALRTGLHARGSGLLEPFLSVLGHFEGLCAGTSPAAAAAAEGAAEGAAAPMNQLRRALRGALEDFGLGGGWGAPPGAAGAWVAVVADLPQSEGDLGRWCGVRGRRECLAGVRDAFALLRGDLRKCGARLLWVDCSASGRRGCRSPLADAVLREMGAGAYLPLVALTHCFGALPLPALLAAFAPGRRGAQEARAALAGGAASGLRVLWDGGTGAAEGLPALEVRALLAREAVRLCWREGPGARTGCAAGAQQRGDVALLQALAGLHGMCLVLAAPGEEGALYLLEPLPGLAVGGSVVRLGARASAELSERIASCASSGRALPFEGGSSPPLTHGSRRPAPEYLGGMGHGPQTRPGRAGGFDGGALEQLFWNEWDPPPPGVLSERGAERAGPASRPAGDQGAVADLSAALEAQLQEYIALPQRYLDDRAAGAPGAPAGPAVAAATAAAPPPRPSVGARAGAPGAGVGEEGEGGGGLAAPAAPPAVERRIRALYDECIRQPGEFHVQEVAERLLERSRALVLDAGLLLDGDGGRVLQGALLVAPSSLSKKYRAPENRGATAEKANEYLLQIVLRFAVARLRRRALEPQDKPVLKELNLLTKGVMFHVHLPGHQWGLKPFFEFVLLPHYGRESSAAVLKLAKRFGVELGGPEPPAPEEDRGAPGAADESTRPPSSLEPRESSLLKRKRTSPAGKKSPLRELVDMVRVPPMASKIASNAGALLRQISVKVKRVSFPGSTPREGRADFGPLSQRARRGRGGGRRAGGGTPRNSRPNFPAANFPVVMETPYKASTQPDPEGGGLLPPARKRPKRSLGLCAPDE